MRLSDRGGASGLIGDRWANLSADVLAGWPGTTVKLHDGDAVRVSRVVRLDDLPEIAKKASRQKLQNPDFIVVGESRESGHVMLAADAKFSIETAGSSQVSAESLGALMVIGAVLSDPLGALERDVTIVDGLFVAPDYSLTHYMLNRKRGYRSVSVDHNQIMLIPVSASQFIESLEGAGLIPVLANVDGYGSEAEESLLLTLYYFRLVRAVIGCWLDQTGPLLGHGVKPALDLGKVETQSRDFARHAASGWNIVEQWDALAETVRTQRTAINHAISVPIVNRELRARIEIASKLAGVEAPSMNKVRRRIGAWFRDQLIEQYGVITPPVDDFPALLQELGKSARELQPATETATKRIIAEMLEEVAKPDEAPAR